MLRSAREEGGEKGIRRLECDDAAQPQLAHEPVLQGLPEALDAPLGLRRMRGDEADAEVLQDPAEVRWGLGPGQFFRQGPVRVIADEDTQAIAVQGQREPGRRTEVL
jgi:hypothetical protein